MIGIKKGAFKHDRFFILPVLMISVEVIPLDVLQLGPNSSKRLVWGFEVNFLKWCVFIEIYRT